MTEPRLVPSRRPVAQSWHCAHGQTLPGPYRPPIRFACCYRCGRSNLSILVWPEKCVKLFASSQVVPILAPYFQPGTVAKGPLNSYLNTSCHSPNVTRSRAPILRVQTVVVASQLLALLALPSPKVGDLGKVFGICRKFWLFRGYGSDSLFRGP